MSPPPVLLERLGHRVRAARTQRSLTLSELAKSSGVSPRFLSDLEAGRGNISVSRLAAVATALGTSADRLLADPSTTAPGGEDAITARLRTELLGELDDLPPAEIPDVLDWIRSRRQVRRFQKYALIGLRGAGKTTVGSRVARRLKMPFVELDREIERAAGMSLQNVFSIHGEPYYRRLEQQVLGDVLGRPGPALIAAGGGIVTHPHTFDLLRGSCLTIWLEAAPDDHWSRVVAQGDQRPMRGKPQAMAELRAILESRRALYARAHRHVDTTVLGLARTVKTVQQAVEQSVDGAGAARMATVNDERG